MQPGIGGPELWTPAARFGRFFYKNIYFWGLPSFFVVLFVVAGCLKNVRAYTTRERRPVAALCFGAYLGYQLLFLKFPIETYYLLPSLPFVAILIGLGARDVRPIRALAALMVVSSLVMFNVARPDVPGKSTGGHFGLWVEPGVVVGDLKRRLELRHCDSLACWNLVTHGAEHPVEWSR
jgi:hypothetical protein